MQTSPQQEAALRKNDTIKAELFKIELSNGEILYLTSDNANVEWGNNKYLALPPIRRGAFKQSQGQGINQISVGIGDPDFRLTRAFLNNIQTVLNAPVTITQIIQTKEGKGIVTRQIFKGKIINPSSNITGVINFTVIEKHFDAKKPINRRKAGDIEDVIDMSERLFG